MLKTENCVLLVITWIFTVVIAQELAYPSDDDVINYLKGLKIPDFQATMVHPPMEMDYSMTNSILGHLSEANNGSHGFYEMKGDYIRVRLLADEGWITGYMKAKITMRNDKTFRYPMEGNYRLHAENSTIIMRVRFPKLGSKNPLYVPYCNATYDLLRMEFNATTIEDPKDRQSMNEWLSKVLHETFSDLYCMAIRADLNKGEESVAFRGMVRAMIDNVFPALGR